MRRVAYLPPPRIYPVSQPAHCGVPVAAPVVYRRPRRVWSRSTYRAPPAVPVVYRSPPSAPVVYQEAPITPRRSRVARAKTHTRNTFLGLTLASQIFTKNKRDRKRYRNVGLGLTNLNEILR